MPQTENYREINVHSPTILARLRDAPIFRKTGLVKARPAEPGEEIITVLDDGTEETKNTAGEDDIIVENISAGGEKYLMSRDKFFGKYEETDREGVFRPKGRARAIENPYDEPIEIQAPWGEKQRSGRRCRIMTPCDENGNIIDKDDVYLNDADSFEDTYERV